MFSTFILSTAIWSNAYWVNPSDLNNKPQINQEKSLKQQNRDFFRRLAKPKKVQKKLQLVKPAIKTIPPDYIWIISPHPDDEILCCSNLMSDFITDGKAVKIIFLTDGDAKSAGDFQTSRDYGMQRRQESILAAQKIGLKKDDLIFLGFPDGELFWLNEHKTTRSRFTNRFQTGSKDYVSQKKYNLNNLTDILKDLKHDFPPSQVYFPDHKREIHRDHKFAGWLIPQIFIDDSEVDLYSYLIHAAPGTHKFSGANDQAKLDLIGVFVSQFHDLEHQHFLEKFARTKESFKRFR